jgi:hypothetical protein
MAVTDVRKMRMLVRNRLVPMRMGVRFLSIPREVMNVLVMFVVAMPVVVFQLVMCVSVLVELPQVQPDTQCHQRSGEPKENDGVSGQRISDSATPNRGATEKYAPVISWAVR